MLLFTLLICIMIEVLSKNFRPDPLLGDNFPRISWVTAMRYWFPLGARYYLPMEQRTGMLTAPYKRSDFCKLTVPILYTVHWVWRCHLALFTSLFTSPAWKWGSENQCPSPLKKLILYVLLLWEINSFISDPGVSCLIPAQNCSLITWQLASRVKISDPLKFLTPIH